MSIAVAEKYHEKRYLQLLENIRNKQVFDRKQPTTWRCRNGGYQHEGTSAPDVCPACNHAQALFETTPTND